MSTVASRAPASCSTGRTLAAGARVFDVSADGKTIVKALDIAREAGEPSKTLTRRASVTVRGGKLGLAFVPV